MQETYGIDIAEPGLLDQHSARWLESRLRGLLSQPLTQFTVGTRLRQALRPAESEVSDL